MITLSAKNLTGFAAPLYLSMALFIHVLSAAETNAASKASFVLCNKSFHSITVSLVSYFDGLTYHERYEDLPKGNCTETQFLGPRIAYLNVIYKLTPSSEPRLLLPASIQYQKPYLPEVYPEKAITHTYDNLFCRSIPHPNASQRQRIGVTDLPDAHSLCYEDEELTLYNIWIIVPVAHYTLNF